MRKFRLITEMVASRTSTAFQYTGNSVKTSGEWFSFWALIQRRRMKEGFLQEGTNLALRLKLASILNDATQVGKRENRVTSLQISYQMLTIILAMYFP